MMRRAIPLETSPSRTKPLSPSRAREIPSILSALPFFPDPHQEEAIEILRRNPDDRETRSKAQRRLRDSVDGITTTSGWHGARADGERAGGYNLDYAMLLSGHVTRKTARLPVGLQIGGYKPHYRTLDDYLEDHLLGLGQRAGRALVHAADRARFRIGEGLLDAACTLHDHGLLDEAEVFFGDGRNSAERLLLRDAVFASEDLTVEQMARILISAPYEVADIDGEPMPRRQRDLEIDERTPLIFVHCAGIELDLKSKSKEVVLEAVDFGSIDTLIACTRAMSQSHNAAMGKVQDLLHSLRHRHT